MKNRERLLACHSFTLERPGQTCEEQGTLRDGGSGLWLPGKQFRKGKGSPSVHQSGTITLPHSPISWDLEEGFIRCGGKLQWPQVHSELESPVLLASKTAPISYN